MADLASAAIEEALRHNWQKAIEINRQIIKETPNDIEALNRLAFAFCETGLLKEAKRIYNKVLTINRFNPIALKNLQRLTLLKGKVTKTSAQGDGNSQQAPMLRVHNLTGLFLEEIGKTKVVTLINLAEAKTISNLHPTNVVALVPRRRGVAVTTKDGVYIGALPDDIASRLFVLIRGGNQYEAYIKSVDRSEVAVFIRELVRKAKFRNQPSFLGKGSTYYPFVRDEVLSDEEKPDVSRLEDLEEEEEETKETRSEESAAESES